MALWPARCACALGRGLRWRRQGGSHPRADLCPCLWPVLSVFREREGAEGSTASTGGATGVVGDGPLDEGGRPTRSGLDRVARPCPTRGPTWPQVGKTPYKAHLPSCLPVQTQPPKRPYLFPRFSAVTCYNPGWCGRMILAGDQVAAAERVEHSAAHRPTTVRLGVRPHVRHHQQKGDVGVHPGGSTARLWAFCLPVLLPRQHVWAWAGLRLYCSCEAWGCCKLCKLSHVVRSLACKLGGCWCRSACQ